MPSEVADVMLPNAQSTPWPKEDARGTWGTLPVRPALAAVLGALTTEPEAWWREKIAAASRRDAVRVWSDSVDVFVPRPSGRPGTTHQRLWSFDDPNEASEVLLARGLLPEGWCGDARRGWYCDTCRGTGWVSRNSSTGSEFCDVCRQHSDRPRTTPDLVAVTSLGVPALLRYEALAREACAVLREYGCPQPERVVWRVSERSDDRNLFAWRGAGGALRVVEGAKDRRIGPVSLWPDGVCEPARELWLSGLALDAIYRDAVRIVVPPVGGVQ